ncbi:hypothetical protein Pmar_PMAR002623 [Perkinsus marinus ATCC 50983]|uniref:SET domain-containing protein n=1 Tax=Perkinsus marinus (strain ATCC 50983 / TXsc) TaxID=423536 RepID=C5LNS7_PERM5|nr:hypothetical protein Pmar_PMAR002623 [Perkinsus marinus ATCC 50983]EER01628.1 hypothetical protein Pmar_PMAR002623 [Perkinsus marinus ATCC 50983]|eukprot:XP_002768910.1 hypothetical protein Pmar_PMAR002623 [Perkinsus marinus ATCC 50983]
MGAEEGCSVDELEKSLNEITILFTDFERNRSDPMMFDPTLMMQLVKYRQKFERTRLRTLAGDESRTDADLSALRAVVQGATTPAVLDDDDSVEVDLGQGVVIDSRTLSPDYRGWAVFPLLSCVNHSCRPNMEIEFSGDGATLVANVSESGSIAAGEELMISYCDIEEDSVGERQKQLDPYGFICNCERCCKRARKA